MTSFENSKKEIFKKNAELRLSFVYRHTARRLQTFLRGMLHIHNHLLQSLHKTPQENMGWIHTDDAEDDIHFLGHYLSGHEDKDHIHSLEHQLIIIETMINLGLYIIHLLSFHNRLI